MSNSKENNQHQPYQPSQTNKQLPPSSTSTPMPKVKPPQPSSGNQ
ncbi:MULTISPECIES: hypothetical protein [unclassified Pseudoalteromonas]|jgi:hypothetical protein|nr:MULTISPECIES: hypothetical protein [unclassified Pseudoalteromonas]